MVKDVFRVSFTNVITVIATVWVVSVKDVKDTYNFFIIKLLLFKKSYLYI